LINNLKIHNKNCFLITFKSSSYFFAVTFIFIFSFVRLISDDKPIKSPTEVRFYRIYGDDNERLPPVLLLNKPNSVQSNVGSKQLTFEIDIYADVSPSFYATFVHCDIDWNEDDNNFINNSGFMRTSDFSWESAPYSSSFYSQRAKLKFPNAQVQFKYSGNYKIKIFEYYNDDKPIAEAKFFVIEPLAEMQLYFNSSFYKSQFQVSNSAYNIEVRLSAPSNLFNSQLKNVVIYRNNRYSEPYKINEDAFRGNQNQLYKYTFPTSVIGFSSYEKRFFLNELPAENVYRTLYMENPAEYPTGNYAVRMPFSDYVRNGNYLYDDNDGAMITSQISASEDNYVYLEFILDPAELKSNEDVFVSGSFNNWNPDIRWLMNWDEKSRLYRLKQWVRRARHDYLYGTGKLNIDTKKFENISFDYFEGNTVYSNHSIIAFAYYRNMDFGGYDSIIGAIIGSPLGIGWSR
jgi:hypothetical protein